MRYKGWLSRCALAAFALSFMVLAYLGLQPAENLQVLLARIFTLVYFGFFWLMPIYSRIDRTKPLPVRVR